MGIRRGKVKCVWHVTTVPHSGSDGVRLELLEVRFPGAWPERGHRRPDSFLEAEEGWGRGEEEAKRWVSSKVLRREQPDCLRWWPLPEGGHAGRWDWSQSPFRLQKMLLPPLTRLNLLVFSPPLPPPPRPGPLPEKTSQKVSDDRGSGPRFLTSQSPKMKTTINNTKS